MQQQKDIAGAVEILLTSLTGQEGWKLMAVLLLTPVNWGIEAKKWQILLQTIQEISYAKAFKAVLTGQALAISSPNNVGEYVGRMVYAEEGNRGRTVALNLVASLSQLLITFIAGITAWIYLTHSDVAIEGKLSDRLQFWLENMFWVIVLFTLLLVGVYYNLSVITNWVAQWPLLKKYNYFFTNITRLHWKELTTVLKYSAFRFVIFLLQYLLMLQVCGVQEHVLILTGITALFFLVLAIVPTIALAELGIRGVLSLQLFGLVSSNMVGILFAATGIWFINRIIPALAGSILVLRIKLFKK
ncbi:lysylphosphatidylglycerol synthase domain-containing protein [Hydrotalea sp.]|uniref:lysylphosphatidylglycerol synthase domain-containing protein n=1 Tax=Hydrotalea sp. TaxID=2881279 RepID=UPI002629C80F|nr:lysylphosphatidylglycerol synthase domain-containing protein [Hydrotalea sp.]